MTWGAVFATAHVLLASATTGHVVLYKRDARAALLWVGLAWLSPVVGTVAYFLFGINRIRRKARSLRAGAQRTEPAPAFAATPADVLTALPEPMRGLGAAIDRVLATPLVPGNRVRALVDGDEAYPAMCSAIAGARTSVSLSTYLFQHDAVGLRFVEALAAAVARGVEVRVLVDDAGARYSFPRIFHRLARAEVPATAFHRRTRFLPKSTLNMRNHRKLCVVDGRTAFTGGMNIQQAHVLATPGHRHVQDVHFELTGPIVRSLQEVFVDDWAFATGEVLDGERWFPALEPTGTVTARAIPEGPDSDLGKLRWSLLAAVGSARRSIAIVTPYFLPDATLVAALSLAALRGVEVDIVLPREPNVVVVGWAVLGTLWQVLEHGCRVWFTPPPFDHSKLMLVDDAWTLLGSANWDPRSFRLNFELDVECYDAELCAAVGAIVARKRAAARRVTAAELAARPLPLRLRDGLARILAPML